MLQGETKRYVPQAMKNIEVALIEVGISKIIHVTRILSTVTLASFYPPSAGAFKPQIAKLLTENASFLSATNVPVLVNIYPYFAYSSGSSHISLEYANFGSNSPILIDGHYQYMNIFDAIVDAFNTAMKTLKHTSVKVYVADTGWQTRGNVPYTSVENAHAYNQGLLKKLTTSTRTTPRRLDVPVVTFLFEVFNEDLKEGEVEKSFGFFTPDKVSIDNMWNVSFSSEDKEG